MDYFDLHCDTLYECYKKNCSIYKNNLMVSIDKACFDNWCQVFAIWIPDGVNNPFSFFVKLYNFAKQQFDEFSNFITVCSSSNQVDETLKGGKTTAILSVEGGSVLEGNIDNVLKLYDFGIRILTLTWNGKNEIASGVETVGGLTGFGRKVIQEMNRIGMVADLSHLNDLSFFEAAEMAENIIATHSNCRTIHNHARNLTDQQLKIIKDKNSLVGICLYPEFLGDNNVFDRIYANIHHLLELGLEQNIAIGSDFDGADMSDYLDNISKIPNLFDYLISRNLGQNILEKIFYKNAYDYFTKLLTK